LDDTSSVKRTQRHRLTFEFHVCGGWIELPGIGRGAAAAAIASPAAAVLAIIGYPAASSIGKHG
jgi:hypothetical protein